MPQTHTPVVSKTTPVSPWQNVADTLRRHPGVFHVIRDDKTTSTTHINNGTLVPFRPAGSFTAYRDRDFRLLVAFTATDGEGAA